MVCKKGYNQNQVSHFSPSNLVIFPSLNPNTSRV
jgi:hypothetical protein